MLFIVIVILYRNIANPLNLLVWNSEKKKQKKYRFREQEKILEAFRHVYYHGLGKCAKVNNNHGTK